MSKFIVHHSALELFNLLASIDPRLPLEKHEDQIIVKNSNDKGTIAYELILTNNVEDGEIFVDFDTEDDKISFNDFKKFYNLRKALTTPEMDITEDASLLTMSEGRSSIQFNLADPHIITRMFDDVPSGTNGYVIDYTATMSKEINKKCGAIGADRVTFTISGKDVTFKLWSGDHHNAWSETLEGVVEEFGRPGHRDFTISNTIFTTVPDMGENSTITIRIEEEAQILSFVIQSTFLKLTVIAPFMAE